MTATRPNPATRILAAALPLLLATGCALYQPDDEFYRSPAPSADDTSARRVAALAEQAAAPGVDVVVRQLPSHSLLGRVTAEVDVVDADSEEDAELMAFFQLVIAAADRNADAVVEVRRSIVDDGTPRAAAATAGILAGSADATSDTLDRQTVRGYWRGEGTLSARRLAGSFDRRGVAGRTIRFTGKAVAMREP